MEKKKKEPATLGKYTGAYKRRNSDTRMYIKILNDHLTEREKLQGLGKERERVQRIVTAWTGGGVLLPDDQEILSQAGAVQLGAEFQEIQPDLTVKTGKCFGPYDQKVIAYAELHEAISGGKERDKPIVCKECKKWFVPGHKGLPKFCSRECDQKFHNRENSESIKKAVKEGRARGDYD